VDGWVITYRYLGRIAPTSFMISVQLNLDQKLNQVHAELRCTKLNSDRLIPFSWTAVIIPWMMLIDQPRSAYGPTTMTSQSHAICLRNSPIQIGRNLFEF